MINEKKIFTGGINADDDIRLLDPSDYINMENCHMTISEDGKNGRVENLYGTLPVTYTLPSGVNITNGSVVDNERNRVIYFVWNSNGLSAIYAYFKGLNQTKLVISNSQVTGGIGIDNLKRVDRNAKLIGDLLIWTTGNDEIRCINVEKALKGNDAAYVTTVVPYTFPLLYVQTTLIKRPPSYEITVGKITDSGFANNFIADFSFQFYYRYTFFDNQISANSPISRLLPTNFKDEPFNKIVGTISTIEKIDNDVAVVEIIVRFGNTGKSFIIKRFDKKNATDLAAINAHNTGGGNLTFEFYNNQTGIAVDDVASVNSEDLIPLRSNTLEIADDRVFLGGNLKGYTSPSETSLTLTYSETAQDLGTPTATAGNRSVSGLNGKLLNLIPASAASTNYAFFTQPSLGASEAPLMYPTYVDAGQCLFENLKSVNVVFVITGTLLFTPGSNPDTNALTFFYITTQGNKTIKRLAVYPIKRGVNSSNVFNYAVIAPPSSRIFFVGVIAGVTDAILFQFSNVKFFVRDNVVDNYYFPHFKSNGIYKIAIAFYDRYRRKSGVVTKNALTVNIPKKPFGSIISNKITPSFVSPSPLIEIPDWAYYYQFLITKNQQQQSFIQSLSSNVWYVSLNTTTNVYTYTQTNFISDTIAIGVNLGNITNSGVGYVYAEGDILILTNQQNVQYSLKIIAQIGNYVHCQKIDVGTLGTSNLWEFEIYTPSKSPLQEVFYECSNVYSIVNPTLSNRAYNATIDDIYGDTYYIARVDNLSSYMQSEAMNPNDKYWTLWDRNIGWVNVVNTIGQVKSKDILFTDTFIPGTKVNGLNKIQALNRKEININGGAIQKLQLANKQQENGVVMLCICSNVTLSIYLGETQVVSQTGNSFLTKSDGVIGTINELKGGNGTINPESVFNYLGEIFWVDAINGVMIQYSTNGLFPISSYKMTSFFFKYLKRYVEFYKDLPNIYGTMQLVTCLDVVSKELLVVLQPVLTDGDADALLPSYNGVPPSYTNSVRNRFDVYDRKGKTIAFRPDKNQWAASYEMQPEWMDCLGTDLIGFKNGQLFVHHKDKVNINRLYGANVAARICFSASGSPSALKSLKTIAIEATEAPSYTVVYSDYPNVQITDLVASDYKNKEGIFYADLFKDRLSPNVTGSADQKMLRGDELTDASPKIMVEFQQNTKKIAVNFVNIGYSESSGHEQIKTK